MILSGMKEISKYLKRSEVTVLQWIRIYKLPANKFGGGVWESDSDLIDEWRRDTIKREILKNGNLRDKI
jgi:hypothetical protein